MNKGVTRLLVLSHSYIRDKDDYAGLFIHTLNKGLQGLNYRITVISPHASGLKTREEMDGIDVIRFRYMPDYLETLAYRGTMHDMVRKSIWKKFIFSCFILAFLFETIKTIFGKKIQLVHSHWWFPCGFIAYLSYLLLRVPYVVTIHGTDARIIEGNFFLTWLFKLVLRRSYGVIVGSEYLKTVLETSLPEEDIKKLAIHKIPMPVEIPPISEINHLRREGNSILTVARFTAQKNLKILIEALMYLKEEGIMFSATIIGDGPLRTELKQQISHSHLDNSIEMLSHVGRRDLFDHYRRCSFFVLPSLKEGLGLVLVEALLMKETVIASNSGGITEIIEDGVSGILFDPYNPRQLADEIKKLLQDPDLAKKLANNGFEKARILFSIENVREKYSRVYQNSIN